MEMFDHTTVIGGVQSGWNVAVRSSENSALPFCTGKSPEALNDSLLAACGLWLPGLMHAASPLSVTWICSTAPSPATFPAAVTVVPEMLIVGDPTKCAPVTPATATPAVMSAATSAASSTRIGPSSLDGS